MTSELETLARQLYAENNGRAWDDESWNVRDDWMSAARQRFDANGQKLSTNGQHQGAAIRAPVTVRSGAVNAASPDKRKKSSSAGLPNKQSMTERRAQETDTNARRILQNEEAERREKSKRLKQARIAAELKASDVDGGV